MKSYESALAIRQKLADANPAVTEYQGRLADCHLNIGVLLIETGKLAEALKSNESARAILQKLADGNPTVIEFQSSLANCHNNIGSVLSKTGKPAEALKSHESARAIRQKLARENPESPDFASNLGGTLSNIAMIEVRAGRFEAARSRIREAIEWQRKALAANPAHPTYRQFLNNHLSILLAAVRGLGDAEGVAEAEREIAIFRDSNPAMVALDARLSAILKGDQGPKDEAERLALAQRAYDKGLHATAARLWGEALASNPRLGDDRGAQHRYNAACAASLAGCGQGKDDPPLDEAARAALRKQALGWLEAELSAWKRVAMAVAPGNKELVAGTLAHWKGDSDLSGIRGAVALAKLPEAERAAFGQLWADVDGLLTIAGGGK
jgi:tetratricopeptide (TPR) repeat protein